MVGLLRPRFVIAGLIVLGLAFSALPGKLAPIVFFVLFAVVGDGMGMSLHGFLHAGW